MLLRRPGFSFLFLLCFVFFSQVYAQADTIWPSYVPLAVRSPYLSAWLGPNVQQAPNLWPQFWSKNTLGWAGFIRVDGVTTYKWLGSPAGVPNLNASVVKSVEVTPTQTIMSYTAGPIDFNVTYLSPIEPSDPVKQSLPFTYISLQAWSNDGNPHTVQVYSDISGEWLSGDNGMVMNWISEQTDTIRYHQSFLATQEAFTENGHEALDSSVMFGTLLSSPKMTHMIDQDVTCRNQFSNHGTLLNTETNGPQVISKNWPVFAISMDLGTASGTTTDPAVWAVGMFRDPVVQYINQQRSPYYGTAYGNPQEAITPFLQDYPHALQRAQALDAALLANASAVSPHYADLVSLTARQAMAGTELTVGSDGDSWNTSDVKMFMKDTGTSNRVNPVEVLYESFPFFLSMNGSYGGWLIEPVLEYASSSLWTWPYAPRDLGTSYPNATGNNAKHNQGVEQSSNMIIMSLAHARTTGDGSLLSQYYPLLKNWTDYLVNNTSPVPEDQVSADMGSQPNSTNLAIKGIIAIGAMAQISAVLHQEQDAQHYSGIATAYVNTWKSLALSSDQHILSTFGASGSWALDYNLFADKWLGTGLVDDATYSAETAYLQTLLQTNPNGLPTDNDPTSNGNTGWTLFTAATVTDNGVRSSMIDQIWNFASKNNSGTIFPTAFTLDGKGAAVGNTASPGVGAIFAPLALTVQNVSISAGTPSGASGSGAAKKSSNIGPIIGGVVGGVGGLILFLAIGFFLWRRRRDSVDDSEKYGTPDPHQPTTQAMPYNYAREEILPWNAAHSHPYTHSQTELPTPVLTTPGHASKSREALLQQQQQQPAYGHSHAPSTSYTTSTAPASSREPPTVVSTSDRTGSSGTPISPSEVQGLRVEVENLRRVMQYLHADRLEPPPTYHEDEP